MVTDYVIIDWQIHNFFLISIKLLTKEHRRQYLEELDGFLHRNRVNNNKQSTEKIQNFFINFDWTIDVETSQNIFGITV